LNFDQLLGLLWQYWTEEAASDVYALMNVGPCYGKGLAIYQACLGLSIRQLIFSKDARVTAKYPSIVSSFRDQGVKKTIEFIKGGAGTNLYKDYAAEYKFDVPQLRNWSGMAPLGVGQPEWTAKDITANLDVHPVDILKLHVIIGAIEGLDDDKGKRNWAEYVDELVEIAALCADGNKSVRLQGWLQTAPDAWRLVDEKLPLAEMQASARRAGNFIATAKLEALQHGSKARNIQFYETWDYDDELTAAKVKETLLADGDIEMMGDDAQLLAGATLAAFENAELYTAINDKLGKALEGSFYRDPFWGEFCVVHPLFSWPRSPDPSCSSPGTPDTKKKRAGTKRRSAGTKKGRDR